MSYVNVQCRLAKRPTGLPDQENWAIAEEVVAAANDGEFAIEIQYISVDPAMRVWMNAGRSYMPAVEIGEVMRALAVGRVIASRHEGFSVGDMVSGPFGVQRYAVSDGADIAKVDTALAPAPIWLSTLGISGLTAYFGLLDVGRPAPGQTVVVSGAAGSVGTLVGQVAKIHGCRVVGIAGGGEKCRFLVEELNFDAAIDYKAQDLAQQLKIHAPDGIDIYFDNVGGATLDAALNRLARGARVVLCGAVSQYNASPHGPANYMQLLRTRSTMAGFVIFDYTERYPEAIAQLADWMRSERLHSREQIEHGDIADFPAMLAKLFTGGNLGKLILAVNR